MTSRLFSTRFLRWSLVCAALMPALFTKGQTISTIAGDGTSGYSGDGAAATLAALNKPLGIAVDASANLYIADFYNHRVRMVNPSGVITTVAGSGTYGFSGDGAAATDAELSTATGVAVDASGNLYIVDQGNQRIRKVNASGIISTVAGNGTGAYSGDGGQATAASLFNPYGVAVDASGNIFIADAQNQVVRKVNTSGVISTYAGNNTAGYSGDSGPATAAELHYPTGLVTDAAGTLYIADEENSRIRMVTTSGIITTIAGTSSPGFSGDGGPATAAQLYDPWGLGLDADGNLYFGDSGNERIRKISTDGTISTIAGNDTGGYAGDGGPATDAEFNDPGGVAVDRSGNIYIDDYYNSRIRYIAASNHSPYFTAGVSQTLTVCEGAGANAINTQMAINDIDAGQTETWNVVTAPLHGTLSGFPTTAMSTGSTVTPSGLNYTATTGFTGSDTFTVSISDGTTTGITGVSVNVTSAYAGTITGIDSVCPGDTAILADSVAGGVWTSMNTTVALLISPGVVVGLVPGADSITYTVTNTCGTNTVAIGFRVRSHASCAESVNTVTENPAEGILLYPNPNQGAFAIRVNTLVPTETPMIVTNVLGEKVMEQTITTNKDNEVSLRVRAGIYFISVGSGNSVLKTRIVVE